MFGTSGIRGPVGETVTAELAVDLGRALADWGTDDVVLGRDPRPTGDHLADAVAAGLREGGADVVDIGLAATPTVARAVGWRDADAGVAVTASHNPPPDNGFKLWLPSGKAFGPDERDAIEDRLRGDATLDTAEWDATGDRRRWTGATERHRDALVSTVLDDVSETDDTAAVLDGLHVIVDIGNGAGGVTAAALDRLGCRVETLNAQPDGRFPGRPGEPTEENCGTLAATVAATDADLGVAHDGDADRMRAVDGTGAFLSGDVLLTLFARDAADPGDAVAVPVDTSLAVDDALADAGVDVRRTPVGDVHVAEAASDPDVAFGGEPSGAWIRPDVTLCPDGPLAACTLAGLVAGDGPLSELAAGIDTYPIRREAVETERKDAVMEGVSETVADRCEDVTTLDGVRVDAGDGWFLIRASGTQPLVRITAEARSDERTLELAGTARELVSGAGADS